MSYSRKRRYISQNATRQAETSQRETLFWWAVRITLAELERDRILDVLTQTQGQVRGAGGALARSWDRWSGPGATSFCLVRFEPDLNLAVGEWGEFGSPSTLTHLHNGHPAAESDDSPGATDRTGIVPQNTAFPSEAETGQWRLDVHFVPTTRLPSRGHG